MTTTPPCFEDTQCCAPARGCPDLVIAGLSLRYGKAAPIWQDLHTHIPACAITAIIGPSGCGKSSLLRCCNGLIAHTPQAHVTGRVRIGGQDISARGVNQRQLRRRVALIQQQPVVFPVSIRRNLDIPLRDHGLGRRAERRQRSERALRAVGLWDEVATVLDRPATTLSGGQQQRLCIARALALEPDILLFDEPCSSLDPAAAAVVDELILNLKRFYTVVIVTHNLRQARHLADHCLLLWPQAASAGQAAARLAYHGPASALWTGNHPNEVSHWLDLGLGSAPITPSVVQPAMTS